MAETIVPLEEVIQQLVEKVKAEGGILFSAVPDRMKPNNYKLYSNGQNLQPWLLSFPQFDKSEDGRFLILSETPDAGAKQQKPRASIWEVRCMHTFAYMNYWNQNLKQLKTLSPFPEVKVDWLRDSFGHALMETLLRGELEIESTGNQQPTLYIDSGLKMPDGNTVYAVIGLNPNNTDGTKQFWSMKGFGTVAESDTSEIGDMLRSYFGVAPTYDHADLTEQVELLSQMLTSVKDRTSSFLEQLEGEVCPALEQGEEFSRCIREYEQQWAGLLDMVDSFPALVIKTPITLAGLREATQKESFRAGLLMQAFEAFEKISTGLHEFFAQNRWVVDDQSTPIDDLRYLQNLYGSGMAGNQKLTELRATLDIYRCLRSAMAAKRADDDYYENYMTAKEHFEELPIVRIASRGVVIDIPEEEREFLNDIESIEQIIDQYNAAEPESENGTEIVLPETNAELLALALNGEEAYPYHWVHYLKAAVPKEDGARELVILPKDSDGEMTCYAVAMRLLEAGRTEDAERYLILGLLYESARCAPVLLKLYRETNNSDAFAEVWNRFSGQVEYTGEDAIFWFEIISDRSPEQALAMAEKSMHMQYKAAYLPGLMAAARSLDMDDLARTFEERLRKFADNAQPNAFEAAIISGDQAAIMEAAQPQCLEALDFSAAQIQKIQDIAEGGEYPTGSSPYEVGCRLYAFQHNRNGLAEQWMWQGVTGQGRISYAELMLLLTNEQRWDEAIRLYESNIDSLKRFESCRRLYLIAYFHNSPAVAQQVFTENLQDVLEIINLMPDFTGKFNAVFEATGNTFYSLLLKLHSAVSHPYLWSVVSEDRSLRERVYDQAQMESLGLDVAKISEIHRNSKYPHGRDAASIAARLYALTTNLMGAAETAALLAGQDVTAQRLLWTIYSNNQNEAAMYDLLVNNELLRQEHHTEYLDFLYARSEYEDFLEVLKEDEGVTEHQLLQRAVAELHTGAPLSDSPETCAQAALNSPLDLCDQLLRTAVEMNQFEIALEILCACFDKWMLAAPAQLRSLVCCGRDVDTALCERIQSIAVERGLIPLAVYIQNVLKVGDVREQAEQLYAQLQDTLDNGTTEEKFLCIQQFQCLYPDQRSLWSVKTVSITVQGLLAHDESVSRKDVAEKLALFIESLGNDPVQFDTLIGMLADSEYCFDYRVYTAIYHFGNRANRAEALLPFFHGIGQLEGAEKKPYFRDYLIRIYYNALADENFPAEFAPAAEQVCLRSYEQSDSVLAALNVCMLEQLQGRTLYSDVLLNYVLSAADSNLESPREILKEMGLNEVPAALALPESVSNSLCMFERILDSGSGKDVLDYLEFCSRFTKESTAAFQELRNLPQNQEMSEHQSILAVELLYSDPKKAEYWELCSRISLNSAHVRMRFLQLCCAKVPGHWEEYVQLCETQSPEENLPSVLAAWAGASVADGQKCRVYIEAKLGSNPNYLSSTSDPAGLYQLTANLCQSLDENVNSQSSFQCHSQIKTISLIAVSTGSPECLKVLQREAGHFLFGSKSDLGLVVVGRLLLADRVEEAHEWLSKLRASVATIKYRSLLDELAVLSVPELTQWCAVSPNRSLLRLMLPDGNQPSADQIMAITTAAFLNGTEDEAAAVLYRLLSMFQEDYAVCNALLEVCKTGFEGSLPLLHYSLMNLARMNAPTDASKIYYSQTQENHILALAILNQLIIYQKQVDTIHDGWNFEQSTIQGLENLGVIVSDYARVQAVEQQVRDSLGNQPQDIFASRVLAWMASITGDWTEYLEQAFAAGQQAATLFIPEKVLDTESLTRSILRLMVRTGLEDTNALKNWLQAIPLDAKSRERQRAMAMQLHKDGILSKYIATNDLPLDKLLNYPIESYGMFGTIHKKLLPTTEGQEPARVYPAVYLLCALAQNCYAMRDIRGLAEHNFRKSNDSMAWCLYTALYQSAKHLMITHGAAYRPTMNDFDRSAERQYNVEEYQARQRLSGLFSGDRTARKKVGAPNLSPWSTINLVLSLAISSSSRADEIRRLTSYMAPGRAFLAEKVLLLLGKTVSDEDKLAVIRDLSIAPIDRYYLAKLLRYPYDYEKRILRAYHLQTQQSAMTVDREYRQLFKSIPETEKKKMNCYKYLLIQNLDRQHLGARINNQKDPSFWEAKPVEQTQIENFVYIAPDYVQHLEPIVGTAEELLVLKQQHIKMRNSNPYNLFNEKLRLSEEIYRRVIGLGEKDEACYRALLRYSVDRFYCLFSGNTQQSKSQAFELLMALLATDGGAINDGPEYQMLVEMINAVGATGLLKSYSSISTMAEDYTAHKNAFTRLRSLLRDNIAKRDIDIIYEVLEMIAQKMSLYRFGDVDLIIKTMGDADSNIGAINGIGWSDIKGHLQRIIRTERNLLSRRAVLDIQCMNEGNQPRKGFFYGIVTNKGTVAADDLTLQAYYEDMGSSFQYTLPRLQPNAKAIFEIPYEYAGKGTFLTGHLDIVGKSKDTVISQQREFCLTLGETSGSELPYNTYNTDGTGIFTFDPETGTVKNSKFFGRTTETSRLRELIAGEDFAEYHSAVVYGVRRTGKTALLEYFKAYVRGMCPDCMCFRVDAQQTDLTVYSVFIDAVLQDQTVRNTMESSDDLEMFAERWKAIKGDDDIDPKMLKQFFRELKELTGKNLFLIVDEIDRLFRQMMDNHQETRLNMLLSTISSILDDNESKKHIHLVICGSNWLMHYDAVGYDNQQIFHRFGDYQIPVGRLPKEDVIALLDSEQINYTDEAKELICEYTGGLIWFVKLLANASIRRAKTHNRSWIYPSDVFFSLTNVLTEQNCTQFYEGCAAGGLERQVIRVMQSLACRKDMYLSKEKICNMMDKDPDDIERAVNNLIRFEIVEGTAVNPDKIRFTLDIYRRYFRSVHPPVKVCPEEPVVFERKFDSSMDPQVSAPAKEAVIHEQPLDEGAVPESAAPARIAAEEPAAPEQTHASQFVFMAAASGPSFDDDETL